jgi:hypothetical protein
MLVLTAGLNHHYHHHKQNLQSKNSFLYSFFSTERRAVVDTQEVYDFPVTTIDGNRGFFLVWLSIGLRSVFVFVFVF